MNQKKQYLPPTLTVVTVKAERGYTQSTQGVNAFSIILVSNSAASTQETWSTDNVTFGDSW